MKTPEEIFRLKFQKLKRDQESFIKHLNSIDKDSICNESEHIKKDTFILGQIALHYLMCPI